MNKLEVLQNHYGHWTLVGGRSGHLEFVRVCHGRQAMYELQLEYKKLEKACQRIFDEAVRGDKEAREAVLIVCCSNGDDARTWCTETAKLCDLLFSPESDIPNWSTLWCV